MRPACLSSRSAPNWVAISRRLWTAMRSMRGVRNRRNEVSISCRPRLPPHGTHRPALTCVPIGRRGVDHPAAALGEAGAARRGAAPSRRASSPAPIAGPCRYRTTGSRSPDEGIARSIRGAGWAPSRPEDSRRAAADPMAALSKSRRVSCTACTPSPAHVLLDAQSACGRRPQRALVSSKTAGAQLGG